MCTWLERKFVFKCPYNHCPPVLILVGFSNLMLPDCLGCICFLTISVLSSSKTDNLLRSSWQPTTEAAQILFILHLNSSYLILTGVRETKVGCKARTLSTTTLFCPLFTFYMMGDPAWVRNCILATRWACSTRTAWLPVHVTYAYAANNPWVKFSFLCAEDFACLIICSSLFTIL